MGRTFIAIAMFAGTIAMSAMVALGADCKPSVLKITGPCPKQVECTNLPDCPKALPCPSVPDCVCNAPLGPVCPSCVCSCPGHPDSPIERMIRRVGSQGTSSIPTPGHWFAPVTLLRLPGARERASWRVQVDPSIEIDHDASWALGLGLGRRWRSGWAVSGQVFALEKNDPTARFVRNPYHYRQLAVAGDSDRWTVGVTVEIPLD